MGRPHDFKPVCREVLGLYPPPPPDLFPPDLRGDMQSCSGTPFCEVLCYWVYGSPFGKSVAVKIARHLNKGKDDHDVETILIDTTLNALPVITSGGLTRSLCGLFNSIASHLCNDELRRRKSQLDTSGEDVDVPTADPLEAMYLAHSALVDMAMVWLGDRYPDLHATVRDHFWDGLSAPEIAALRDIREETARTRLYNGRARICEYLLDRAVQTGALPEPLVSLARTWLDPEGRRRAQNDPNWRELQAWMFQWVTRS